MTKFTQAHCNTCLGDRQHAILHEATRQWIDYDPEGHPSFIETGTYQMVQCCGCEEIKVKVAISGPYPQDPPSYFPPAIFRRRPEWMTKLLFASLDGGSQKVLSDLLTELYKGLQNDMPRLSAMGVRAVLEAVMLDKVGDQGSFLKNVAKFADEGYIAKKQVPRVMSVLDAGSATIHRGFGPSSQDVIAMVNLTENLIESIYFHDEEINGVASRVPPRHSNPKAP
jgi:hypothetical protein